MADLTPLPFAEAAGHYRNGRAPYASQAIRYVCEAFQLTASARVLDLGCGPGTLAIPLAAHVGEVVAVDQDPAMLAEGRSAAAANNITWCCARAEDFDSPRDTFDVATFGLSLHWMDRDLVFARLSAMIRAGGGLALVAPHPEHRQETWEPIVDALVARYIGHVEHPQRHRERRHEPALSRSRSFARLESQSFPVAFTRDVGSVLEYVYSLSTSPRSRFGERIADFERDLRAALLTDNPSGVYKEHMETEVVIARKQP
jgi:SAM-dependent methyltransferase